MKKKNTQQKKLPKFKKEEFKNISTTEFDAVMNKILSVPPQKSRLKKRVNNKILFTF
jgi:hypothetical protein